MGYLGERPTAAVAGCIWQELFVFQTLSFCQAVCLGLDIAQRGDKRQGRLGQAGINCLLWRSTLDYGVTHEICHEFKGLLGLLGVGDSM